MTSTPDSKIINPTQAHSVVILGNGEFPSAPKALAALADADFVACCDAGADKYIAHFHRLPDVIVGDGDSISQATRQACTDRFVHIAEQETNDQTKTVMHLASLGKRHISIVGATGLREDHTLGNISLLIDYLATGMEVNMITDQGTFTALSGDAVIASHPGQKISIFNFTCSTLAAEGLEYPLRPFTNWWQGTLNRSTATQITFTATGTYLIYLPHE